MSPRQRVERALHGLHVDHVPFTMYENYATQCTAERKLRHRGMCIVQRRINVFKTHTPDCIFRHEVFFDNGRRFARIHCSTPVGDLSALVQESATTTWYHEWFFKSPEDYKALLFLIHNERYEANYAAFVGAADDLGEDFILRAGFGLEPLQHLISGNLMSMETFGYEWMDRRDEVLKLYDAIVANRRKIYPIVAESPALFANYGGNVVPQITGPDLFREYYLPHYNEAAEILHREGKKIGCHFDDDCRLLAPLIAQTNLDYIEAFTPAPETDMSLADARSAWPDKILWLNFPSTVHLQPLDQVYDYTKDLLKQAKMTDRLLIGITDDIPNTWRQSCHAIMDALEYPPCD